LKPIKTSLIAILFAAFSPNLLAEEGSRSAKWNVSFSLAVISTPLYTGDDKNRTLVAPNISASYANRLFASLDEGLRFNVLSDSSWSAGPIVNYQTGRLQDGSEPFSVDQTSTRDLQGLGDVDGTVVLGAFLHYSRQQIKATFELQQGLDSHKGITAEAALQWSGLKQLQNISMLYAIGPNMNFGDANYIAAYYDVNQQQSELSGLPIYETKGGGIFSYGVSGFVAVPINNKLTMIGFGELEVLSDDIAKSSLVSSRGSEIQPIFGLAIDYSF